jgi:hypothetical protein
MGSHLTFNIYSENSCDIACGADHGQQLEVIAHGMPVEITKALDSLWVEKASTN